MTNPKPETAKVYHYVGSPDLRNPGTLPDRYRIASADDVFRWISESKQERQPDGGFVATFVIDTAHRLWIADRRSEHVHCSRFGDVLSAGEFYFTLEKRAVYVASVTNQSTGYCPEQSSWPVVQAAL